LRKFNHLSQIQAKQILSMKVSIKKYKKDKPLKPLKMNHMSRIKN
jgi:hypothetical protein